MTKDRTEDVGKSPSEEHRYAQGLGGEGDGGGGDDGGPPSNADEERLFPRGT